MNAEQLEESLATIDESGEVISVEIVDDYIQIKTLPYDDDVFLAPSVPEKMYGPSEKQEGEFENLEDLGWLRKDRDQLLFETEEVNNNKLSPTIAITIAENTIDDYEAAKSLPKNESSVCELKLDELEISDKYIDERIKLAIAPAKVGYLPSVKLAGIGACGIYQVVEDYSYDIDYQAIGRHLNYDQIEPLHRRSGKNTVPHLTTITARKGFQFDRASIPRIVWPIISKDDLSNVPPLFHDLIYRYGGELPQKNLDPYTSLTRNEADNLFVHLMLQSGVKRWRASLAGQAVRKFGGSAWRSNQKRP